MISTDTRVKILKILNWLSASIQRANSLRLALSTWLHQFWRKKLNNPPQPQRPLLTADEIEVRIWAFVVIVVIMIMVVVMIMAVIVMMIVAVLIGIGFLVEPLGDVGGLGLRIVQAAIHELPRIDLAEGRPFDRRRRVQPAEALDQRLDRLRLGDVGLGEDRVVERLVGCDLAVITPQFGVQHAPLGDVVSAA